MLFSFKEIRNMESWIFFLNLDMIIPGGGVNIPLPYSILVLYGIDIIIIFLLSHFSG